MIKRLSIFLAALLCAASVKAQTTITSQANSTYRDYETSGQPLSGPHNPSKPEIRNLFGLIDTTIPKTSDPHTWSGTQTFTVPPVFTNQAGTRSALGLGALAVLNTIACSHLPAMTGDVTTVAASCATIIANNAVTTAKILDGAVTGPKMASGAAVTNIGYTPANKAGDTFSGPIAVNGTGSQIRVGALGTYLYGDSGQSMWITTGSHNNGTNWIADGGTSSIFGITPSAGIYLFSNTGLTPGASFTPTLRGTWDASGNMTANSYSGNGSGITGISAGNFTGTGTGAITQTVNAKLDRDVVTMGDYAVASPSLACATDAAGGMQNAINKAGNGTLRVTPGYWCFSGALVLVSNGLKIECAPGAYLVKISATQDGFVSGNTLPATFDDLVVRDCVGLTKTGVTPTGGNFWHIQHGRRILFDGSFVGTRTLSGGGSTKHSYNAFAFTDGVDSITFSNSGAWGAVNDCILAYGAAGSANSELRITNNSQAGGCTQKALHVTGGLGGIYCESFDQVTSGTGTYFDRTSYNVTNREFFPSLGCTMDSNTSHGFYFAANSIQTIRGAPWAASNGGDGMQVASPQDTTNTHIQIGNGHFYGNGTHGLNVQAGHLGVFGGTYFNNGTSGAGSGILIYGTGVQSAHVEAVRTYLNHDYGVDNQANANVTSFGPIYSTNNPLGPWRSVNALLAPLTPLPTTCTSQPTGGLRNNAGAVNVC